MPLKLRKFGSLNNNNSNNNNDNNNNNNNNFVLKIKGSSLQITMWKSEETKYNLF